MCAEGGYCPYACKAPYYESQWDNWWDNGRFAKKAKKMNSYFSLLYVDYEIGDSMVIKRMNLSNNTGYAYSLYQGGSSIPSYIGFGRRFFAALGMW